jgi:hypothetical protein
MRFHHTTQMDTNPGIDQNRNLNKTTTNAASSQTDVIRQASLRSYVLTSLIAFFAIGMVTATPAQAETTTPQWTVTAVSSPTNFAVGSSEDSYVVVVTNSGSAANQEVIGGENTEKGRVTIPVTITDELPPGLEAIPSSVSAEDLLGVKENTPGAQFGKECTGTGTGGISCTYDGVVPVDDSLYLRIPVRATSVGSVTNVVHVSGGGAASAAMETPTSIFASAKEAKEATLFGLPPGGTTTTLSSAQAGAHPDLTTTGAFDTESALGATAGSVKDITDDLPAGFAGDLVDTPACQAQLFLHGECPLPTQVGVTTQIFLFEGSLKRELEPVYNLAPEPGDVAKIGFTVAGFFHYAGDIAVRAPDEGGAACDVAVEPTACEPYGLKTTFYNATGGGISYDGFALTIWGVPASPVHDPLRWGLEERPGCLGGGCFGVASSAIEAPYFTNPTACTSEPLQAELHVTSWQEKEPGAAPNSPPTVMPFGPLVGCDRLSMAPSLTAEVTSDAASSATGFDFDTKIPQTYPNPILATSTLNKEVVTLPEGMTLNPSSGAGLTACSEAQYAEELAPAKTAGEKEQGHGCPNSSKLATVKIKTPSFSEEVVGSAYLAESAVRGNRVEAGRNPFNSLVVLYVVVRARNGVLGKAVGLVEPNPVTGRLTTTFGPTPAFAGLPASPGLPPLPESDISFEFNQGANAPLVTPPTCGNYTVEAALTPWSDPEEILDPSIPPFPIATGVGGGSCPAGGVPPFNPGVTAGTENNDAGSYSALDLRISRNDGEQEITGFASQLPLGLTGNLTGIPFCGESEIRHAREQTGVEDETSPACPVGSEIGYSVATAGVGSVLAQTPGKIYLGGPYEGAPFSVVSVTSAHVGPFDLGTVVIHFPLDINPETADVTIPAGQADQIPHIIKGIVIHVREIRAFVNRHDFMLNPTSCNPFNFSATVIGGGADPTNPAGYDPVTVSTPFRVTACQALKFEPKLAVATSGKTSKADGASLTYKLTYPANALGNDANIKYVKVTLPKALPSRLTTLQRACLAKEFAANPASCPPESAIGRAHAVVPNLPVPLEGPVYFVSHGGEAFPSLEVVLQGDGVTVILVGATYISPQGVTSTTFHAVPDNPVTSFEITLPEGKFSALGTNKNLCALTTTKTVKTKVDKRVKGKLVRKNGKLVKVTKKTTKTVAEPLVMGNEYIAQNGATYNANTTLTVTGCPKAKPAKKAKKGKSHKKGAKHKK